jgi:hypothetical protein
LFAIPLPPLFHETGLKLIVHIRITNVMVGFKEVLNAVPTSPRSNLLAREVGDVVDLISPTFILNDHVMHDHACQHDVPKVLLIPKPC